MPFCFILTFQCEGAEIIYFRLRLRLHLVHKTAVNTYLLNIFFRLPVPAPGLK